MRLVPTRPTHFSVPRFGSHIPQTLILANLDPSSPISILDKDTIFQILQYFIPPKNQSSDLPYLLPSSLSRKSYYRICREECPRTSSYRIQLPRLPTQAYHTKSFQAKLVPCAARVIQFLTQIEASEETNFSKKSEKEFSDLFDQYLIFLRKRQKKNQIVVPTLAVQAIWFSHMLQSDTYYKFVSRHFPILKKVKHLVTEENYDSLKEKKKLFKVPSSLVNSSDFQRKKTDLMKKFTSEMVINDQDWFQEFLIFTNGIPLDEQFLIKSHIGYQRFLDLKRKLSSQLESIGFAPCPSIDLIWHTHLLHPKLYRQDTMTAIGQSPKHKLLALEDRTVVFLNDRDDKQEAIWRRIYGESLFDYGGMDPFSDLKVIPSGFEPEENLFDESESEEKTVSL